MPAIFDIITPEKPSLMIRFFPPKFESGAVSSPTPDNDNTTAAL